MPVTPYEITSRTETGWSPEPARAVGRLGPPVPGVERIAVLRGGGLGDLVFALPAMHALRETYPDAEMVLYGPAWQRELLASRPGPVDRTVTLPPVKGVHDPGPDVRGDPLTLRRFFAATRAERFDLGVQLHGGGRWSNPFLQRFGVRCAVGARTPDAAPLDRWLPFSYYQHEVLRMLEIVGLVGAAPTVLQPWLSVTEQDLTEADEALRGLPRPLLVVHPSAGDTRRWWPAAHFARVAAVAAQEGAGVAVIGTDADAAPAAEVVRECLAMLPVGRHGAVRSLVGRLSMSGLVGVLARATAVLANDSGPRHVAQAVGTPTVSVYWCGNVINAGPFGRGEHRVHISWTTRCPECGVACTDPTGPRCPHDVSFVADVDPVAVSADVLELLGDGGPSAPRGTG
ncbi:ADP-heptose:LPS heptosyltransferase [Streptoalloteichus tenebrarius]|uniref:ADP-heptose:LPS heptosyltransferase n=1 Tax=Streptoalloteichus tenebrarius (strain ATCC 17920 / DSM 40477 / JCM 4838 / CBS 697.72 / NBRC 16177 / NCIMB 11028 / NRRL B-12390 / A12253. 1 / ISP 5477) TaxID=1933 RepID=A0ABT1HQA4_STRSD|nr:glycosyltransferase family 9 protein [Streptoalloteichus tenebrarius]MCP2257693.1 ADP-heptose:LPS heptosyltransferase [Streptoalloteichus tenebrarius]BFE99957.1 glycosyltransferase family 9 protein [Streptoalloteichus tenebrarius]